MRWFVIQLLTRTLGTWTNRSGKNHSKLTHKNMSYDKLQYDNVLVKKILRPLCILRISSLLFNFSTQRWRAELQFLVFIYSPFLMNFSRVVLCAYMFPNVGARLPNKYVVITDVCIRVLSISQSTCLYLNLPITVVIKSVWYYHYSQAAICESFMTCVLTHTITFNTYT